MASSRASSIRPTTVVVVVGPAKGRTYGLLCAAQVNYTRKLRRRNKYLGHSSPFGSGLVGSGSGSSTRAKIIIGPHRRRSPIAFFAAPFSQRASLQHDRNFGKEKCHASHSHGGEFSVIIYTEF